MEDKYLDTIRKNFEDLSKIMLTPEAHKAFENIRHMTENMGKALVAFVESDAVKNAAKIAEQIRNIKISIPEDTLKNFTRARFLKVLDEYEWPLYLVFTDELMDDVYELRDIGKNPEELIYTFCNREFWKRRMELWNQSSIIEKERIPILKEAVVLYWAEHYYGAVSILVCQLMGIISDTYEMQRSYGKDFTLDDITATFQHYNPGKELPKNLKKSSEKNQLLWFVSDAQEGFVYWIYAINYIYSIVLTSENKMSNSNHPCRNKICHGDQVNYGTKEHALKAMLTIDMMIQLAESLKRVNDAQNDI